MAWLGYYLGQSTNVKQLYFSFGDVPTSCSAGIEVFRRGLGHNKSIREITFYGLDESDGQVFIILDQFLKNNHRLEEFDVEGCELTAESIRQISLAIGGCNKSMNHFSLRRSRIRDGNVVDIITALSMHPQLAWLNFERMNI